MARTLYRLFLTEFGWVGIAGRDERIWRLILPRRKRSEAEETLKASLAGEIAETEREMSEVAEQVAAYFAGERVDFECDLDPDGVGEFDLRVWEAAREIPYGETRAYGWVATCIGHPTAARAVGQALGRNPVPIIVPCHRVIRSDGSLGGFGSGREWKTRLLSLERAHGGSGNRKQGCVL